MKLSFIGLGKLGLPCSEVFADNGHTVKGYDIKEVFSDKIDIQKSIESTINDADIVFISVPTPHDPLYDGMNPTSHLPPKDFDYSSVIDVLKKCNEHMNKNQILVLISTVLPGTIRNNLIKYVTNTKFVHNPYFIAMGSVKFDMINPDLIILGNENGKKTQEVDVLIDLYKTITKNNPPIVICNWDECESIKVFYNTLISTKLSFVNMIQDVSHKLGNINVDIVTDALCKSTDRIISSKYMKAGMGDGGACHPRDNIALRHLSEKLNLGYDFFGSIMHIREIQAKNVASELIKISKKNNLPIIIYGKSYKPGVPYIDGSYSILIGFYCDHFGITPTYIDPLIDNDKIKEKSLILLAHNNINNINIDIPEESVVFDMWRNFVPNPNLNIKVIYYGNSHNKY